VHKGRRGGSMRTRYFGQLEGVDPDTRDKVMQAAAAAKISVKDWLEQAISKAL
jgi:predicted HicB family RNase H-like nuclease